MADSQRIRLTGLATLSVQRRWLLLVGCTCVVITLLWLMHIPAYFLIGAMTSGVLLAVGGGGVRIPIPALFLAQSFVGCMIGRSISPDIIRDVVRGWPMFLLMVSSVSIAAFFIGYLLVKSKALPGTTGIWGLSPGAALVMTMMSEGYGADSRLVAMMQYSRVMIVSLVATMVASVWGSPAPMAAVAQSAALAGFDWPGFLQTVLVAGVSLGVAVVLRFSAGPILLPLILGSLLNLTGIIRITLPPWLLAACYCTIGWGIGLRFNRQIVMYAIKALPKIVTAIVCLIVACGLVAAFVAHFAGIDPLAAYLALSPGGMDAVAIISASMAPQNMSFIMAVQVCRFILVSLTSPPLATYIVKKTGMTPKRDSVRM